MKDFRNRQVSLCMVSGVLCISTTSRAGYNCISKCSCSMIEGEIVADCVALNFTSIPVPSDYQVYLATLQLNNNNLTELPRLVAPALTSLDASYNNLQELTHGIMAGCPAIQQLFLQYNPALAVSDFAVFRDVPHLTELNLEKCSVHQFVEVMLPSLKVLLLSENYITEANTSIAATMPLLQRIDLSFNNLSIVNPSVFKSENLKSVDFSANTFQCDCSLLPFVNWVKRENEELNVVVIGSTEYMCSGPAPFFSQLVLHAVDGLDCTPKPEPQKATIAMEIVLGVVTGVALLFSVLIACYCRRRVSSS
uniref:LRRCT domain-containing protein n=1 Tax=Ciona savignyi TaxID=51511 RepID=H2ZFG4_CIOSA